MEEKTERKNAYNKKFTPSIFKTNERQVSGRAFVVKNISAVIFFLNSRFFVNLNFFRYLFTFF